MPKGSGSRKRKANAPGKKSWGGRILNTVKNVLKWVSGKNKKPKGFSGRGGGKTSRRMAQAGGAGR